MLIISGTIPLVYSSPAKSQTLPNVVSKQTGNIVVDPAP